MVHAYHSSATVQGNDVHDTRRSAHDTQPGYWDCTKTRPPKHCTSNERQNESPHGQCARAPSATCESIGDKSRA